MTGEKLDKHKSKSIFRNIKISLAEKHNYTSRYSVAPIQVNKTEVSVKMTKKQFFTECDIMAKITETILGTIVTKNAT